MLRMARHSVRTNTQAKSAGLIAGLEINEIGIDDFITAEPTPKHESRRGWRRRRVRRGKS